jgi:hypothetical protein
MQEQGANIFESIPEQKNSAIASGLLPSGALVANPKKLQIMRVMKQELKYIVEYLVKRRTPDTNYLFSHSYREGFSTNQRLCNPKIFDIEIVKQG